ncbi:hypothetical protein D3C85_1238280 [compost metagenome]
MQVHMRADQRLQFVALGRRLLGDAPQGGQQLFVELFDQIQQQVLFAGVMVIQRTRRESQAGRELTHADLAKTLAGEQLQDFVPVLGEACATLRHRHGSRAPFCVPDSRRRPFP